MKIKTHGCAPRGAVVIDPFKLSQIGGDWRDYAGRMNHLYDLYDNVARREPPQDYAGVAEGEVEHADWAPAFDVVEREAEFLILVDLPGIDRAALDVNVDDDRLVVRGERAREEGVKQTRNNRPAGRFQVRFGPLPQTIDQTKVGAEYRDGVLRLRLPRRAAEHGGRVKIEIK